MNKNGFTLLELLFVLGILSVLIVISAPLNVSTLEKQQLNHFFKTFESDVLYIQNLSTFSDSFIKIRFFDEYYKIEQDINKTLVKRNYPTGLKVGWRLHHDILFSESGTVINPRTIDVKMNNETYHIVFPLGKGRCYIVKKQ